MSESNIGKEAKAELNQQQVSSSSLFDCLHSLVPAKTLADGKTEGPWHIDTIYKHGMAGDAWLAERIVDEKSNTMIRIRANDTTYVDLIDSNGNQEILVMDPYGAHPLEKGTEEEKSVLEAIGKVNFEACTVKR